MIRQHYPFENKDFYLLVAATQVAGVEHIKVFGINTSVDSNYQDVWENQTLYQYPSSAETMTVSSTSSEDNENGDGVYTVKIHGLDANFNKVCETVELLGQSEVTLSTQLIRIIDAYCLSNGSGAGDRALNAGNIYIGTGTVTSGVPANIYGMIEVGRGKMQLGAYTVPADFTGYLLGLNISSNDSDSLEVSLRTREEGSAWVELTRLLIGANSASYDYKFPIELPSKSDISCITKRTDVVGTSDLQVEYSILLVKNENIW